MLAHLDCFFQHPTIKGRLDPGSLEIQFRLLIHNFGHITRGNQLFSLGSDQSQLIFKRLEPLQTCQISLFGFIHLGLRDNLFGNKRFQAQIFGIGQFYVRLGDLNPRIQVDDFLI